MKRKGAKEDETTSVTVSTSLVRRLRRARAWLVEHEGLDPKSHAETIEAALDLLGVPK